MTNEEHGQEFLQFVAKNEARLKKNLQKNITYNPDIFDDVFQDRITGREKSSVSYIYCGIHSEGRLLSSNEIADNLE